jgi:hypothetical protein
MAKNKSNQNNNPQSDKIKDSVDHSRSIHSNNEKSESNTITSHFSKPPKNSSNDTTDKKK